MRFFLVAAVLALPLADAFAALTVEVDKNPPVAFSEAQPAYLFFKKLVATRKSKNSYEFVITLNGDIPSNSDDRLVFVMNFDIDNNPSTGGMIPPAFGNDISLSFTKDSGSNRFMESSGSLSFRGKTHSFDIGNLKVRDGQISFTLRSELFAYNDTFNFMMLSNVTKVDKRGEAASTYQVDGISPPAAVTFTEK